MNPAAKISALTYKDNGNADMGTSVGASCKCKRKLLKIVTDNVLRA